MSLGFSFDRIIKEKDSAFSSDIFGHGYWFVRIATIMYVIFFDWNAAARSL